MDSSRSSCPMLSSPPIDELPGARTILGHLAVGFVRAAAGALSFAAWRIASPDRYARNRPTCSDRSPGTFPSRPPAPRGMPQELGVERRVDRTFRKTVRPAPVRLRRTRTKGPPRCVRTAVATVWMKLVLALRSIVSCSMAMGCPARRRACASHNRQCPPRVRRRQANGDAGPATDEQHVLMAIEQLFQLTDGLGVAQSRVCGFLCSSGHPERVGTEFPHRFHHFGDGADEGGRHGGGQVDHPEPLPSTPMASSIEAQVLGATFGPEGFPPGNGSRLQNTRRSRHRRYPSRRQPTHASGSTCRCRARG